MLGGIVIGMNAISMSHSISKGEYAWATVNAVIILVAYLVETRKKSK